MRVRSLRRELLGWIVIPLAMLVGFNVWTSYRNALSTADFITNRTLVASARVIAESIRMIGGIIDAPIPPAALEMFASEQHDLVIYKVIGPDRHLISGTPEIDTPQHLPAGFETQYFDEVYRGAGMRAVAIAQPVVTMRGTVDVVVIVGQTLRSRNELVRVLWLAALRDQVLLVAGAAVLSLFGLRRGLAPLIRLRDKVQSRDPSALDPLAVTDVQTELRPLVEALNEALAGVRRQIVTQRRFVANAAHQLRTPLALLRTQANVGLREGDLAGKNEALRGIDQAVDRMARLATQLLVLARAEQGSATLSKEPVNFAVVVREAMEALAELAFSRNIDLGFEGGNRDYTIEGHAPLLGELVHNIVENALRYGASGGHVTASLREEAGSIVFRVVDDGPGIPEAERARVFERFYRLLGTDVPGTGLGLAIVQEIAASHDGTVELGDRAAGHGLIVTVRLPR